MSGFDYSVLLGNLLPPGPAWNKNPDSTLSNLLIGISQEFSRLDDQARGLIQEANPLTMSNMLPIRYEEAGLPDPCRGEPSTFAEKQIEVVSKWYQRGGQSASYYQAIANWYGFNTRVFEYAIWQMEITAIETTGIDDAYNYAWSVDYVSGDSLYFRAGENSGDDYIETFQTGGIPCLFERIKPAHTTIVYTPWPTGTDMSLLSQP